jgi:spore coat polysaccharide biosynthesis protein SpsF
MGGVPFRTVGIIQARMGSTRLPGKVLQPLAGRPALWHVVTRLKHCKNIHEIVLATTTHSEDDRIVEWCAEHNVACFRGSAQDVLDRYYQTAKQFHAAHIVRITADCPLIDPEVIDEVVQGFRDGHYHVYGLGGEFPDGLDCEAFTFPALEAAWRLARRNSDREHVTPFLHNHPGQFRTGHLEKFVGLSHHRWTLDEKADLIFLQEVFTKLFSDHQMIKTQDVLDLLEREPHLMTLNQGIIRNEGYLRSLEQDCEVTSRRQYGYSGTSGS